MYGSTMIYLNVRLVVGPSDISLAENALRIESQGSKALLSLKMGPKFCATAVEEKAAQGDVQKDFKMT